MKADFKDLEIVMYDLNCENNLTFTADVSVTVDSYESEREDNHNVYYAHSCNIDSFTVSNIRGIEVENFQILKGEKKEINFVKNGIEYAIIFDDLEETIGSENSPFYLEPTDDDNNEDDDNEDDDNEDDSAYYNHLTYLECKDY